MIVAGWNCIEIEDMYCIDSIYHTQENFGGIKHYIGDSGERG